MNSPPKYPSSDAREYKSIFSNKLRRRIEKPCTSVPNDLPDDDGGLEQGRQWRDTGLNLSIAIALRRK